MEIVIDIPEELYKRIPTKEYIGYMDMSDWQKIIMSVSNGIPLPKGHGNLIDADALANEIPIDVCDGFEVTDIIEATPAIIEADKEE